MAGEDDVAHRPRGFENTDSNDESAGKPYRPQGGEDEASSADEDGNDDHLHEDQKPIATVPVST